MCLRHGLPGPNSCDCPGLRMPLTTSSMWSYWSPYYTPQVRWTGTSNKGAEVLDWHRKVLANGTRPSVQVDGGAVLLGLMLARQAEVRPAPPQRLYQAFIAEDAQVVQIRIEAAGASIAGGSPLDDAVGYGCWQVARLLVARGARVERLWHAPALGMTQRVDELMAAAPPTHQALIDAFWQACSGGQLRMAQYLLPLGADLNGTPSWGADRPLDVADGIDTGRQALVNWLRAQRPKKSSEAGS